MVTADIRPDVVPEVVNDALYASWSSRVIATVVDGFVLSGLLFLVAGAGPFVLPIPFFGDTGMSLSDMSWGTRAAVVGASLVLVLTQAYGGASPGKRVVGIAVVDDQTGRPVGLLRTLVRDLAHLLDAILLIGYLRPLWHAERRTFADSFTGTIALRTRTVRPNLLVERLVGRSTGRVGSRVEARGSMGEPATGPWENRVTGGVAVVAFVLALFSFPWMSSGSGETSMSDCSFPVLDSGSFAPTGVTLRADSSTSSSRRLWVETTSDVPAGTVTASWTWNRTTTSPTTLRLVATAADGVTQTDSSTTVPVGTPDDGSGAPAYGDIAVDVRTLREGWTAEATMLVDGDVVASCTLAE